MSAHDAARCCLVLAMLGMAGCSPTLNWRQAPLGVLQFSLPCKPDKAQREVPLAGKSMTLEMQGCEADGALFAISRIRVRDAAEVPTVTKAWRESALTALRSEEGAVREGLAPNYAHLPGLATAQWLQATGQRPKGGVVQAQLAWLVWGSDVYHLAVYADQLGEEMTEPFFTGLSSL